MTDDRLPLAELLGKAGDGDFLRSVAKAVLQMLMEADVEVTCPPSVIHLDGESVPHLPLSGR